MRNRLVVIALNIALFAALGCSHTSEKPAAPSPKVPTAGFDAELTTYSYPFPVHYYNFRAQEQDLKMAYMDLQPSRAPGQTIVLLHGKNFTGAYFEELAKSLVAKNYRVIIPDQIGFGKSTKPKNYQYSFHALAQNTQNLLKHLDISRYQVFGHSMGGMVATRLSLMYPEQVTRLFLVNPIGLEDWKTMTSYRSIEENYKNELSNTPEKAKAYQVENYYDGQWKPEYEKWVEVPRGWIEGPDHALIAWNAALTSDMAFTQPVFYEFKNLKVPTVLVIGQKDKTALGKAWAAPEMKAKMGNYPKLGRDVAKLIPKVQLVEIKNVGHLPFIEDFNGFWKVFEPKLK